MSGSWWFIRKLLKKLKNVHGKIPDSRKKQFAHLIRVSNTIILIKFRDDLRRISHQRVAHIASKTTRRRAPLRAFGSL